MTIASVYFGKLASYDSKRPRIFFCLCDFLCQQTTNCCWVEINIFIAELFGNENDFEKYYCSSSEIQFSALVILLANAECSIKICFVFQFYDFSSHHSLIITPPWNLILRIFEYHWQKSYFWVAFDSLISKRAVMPFLKNFTKNKASNDFVRIRTRDLLHGSLMF